MNKKKSVTHYTEVHFHAPVGQYIDYIENQTVAFDKDMNMQIRDIGSVAQEQHLILLTAQCIKEGKAQEVENELRSAASGSAKKLLQCIRMNEALGYIDTKNLSSQALYDELNACFGLKYTYQNFAKYRRD